MPSHAGHQCPGPVMTTLLESRTHHHHVHALSQKAQESFTHHEEPPKRWIPAVPSLSPAMENDGDRLTRWQHSQRERRQNEKLIQRV